MNYREAMDYLKNLTKFGINLGLGRIENLLTRLGNPHKDLNVIHVGGTNGKGSTSAFISAILKAQGYNVGSFTSPHLHSYTERYRINGQNISETEIAGLISLIRPVLDEMVEAGIEHPTEFEVSTALAFLYFKRQKVDFVVLEVGLGGAIDSTNVVQPIVSVITNVAMDHMDYLGNSLAEIARVKAGIIKEGSSAVTAANSSEVLSVLREVSQEKGVKLIEVGRDIKWELINSTTAGQIFDYSAPDEEYKGLEIKLIGYHQVCNAVTAVTVIKLLKDRGYTVTPEAIRKGLAATAWPARMEIMQHKPMVIIDGAHNYDGAVVLRKALEGLFSYRSLVLVIGMLADKEREKVVAQLVPLARKVIVTKPNNPRAADWQTMGGIARKYISDVTIIEDIKEAVEEGISTAKATDLLCITGSLYMVAEARERWLKA